MALGPSSLQTHPSFGSADACALPRRARPSVRSCAAAALAPPGSELLLGGARDAGPGPTVGGREAAPRAARGARVRARVRARPAGARCKESLGPEECVCGDPSNRQPQGRPVSLQEECMSEEGASFWGCLPAPLVCEEPAKHECTCGRMYT